MLGPDSAVDLQIHTIYSDGTWTPLALVEHVQSQGFRLIGITDHDTAAGVEVVRRLAEASGVAVIAGVEATASWRGRVAHVLCYAPHTIGSPLLDLVAGTVERMALNTRDVFDELLRRGHRFPRQADLLAETGGEPRRPVDNAILLVSHGYAPSMDAALEQITDAGYVIATSPLSDVVAAAHASGALAILAHPGRGGGEIQEYSPELVLELIGETALDGIEAYYPLHSDQQVAAYSQLAAKKGLVVSAGSDSHGPAGRLPVSYPASIVRGLLGRLGIEVEAG